MIWFKVIASLFWVSIIMWMRLIVSNKSWMIFKISRRWESLNDWKKFCEISNEKKNFWWNLIDDISFSLSIKSSNTYFIEFELKENKIKLSRSCCRDMHCFEKIVFKRFEANNKTRKKSKNMIDLYTKMSNIFKLFLRSSRF